MGEAKRRTRSPLRLDKQAAAKWLMGEFMELERKAHLGTCLTSLEFATAMRIYTDDIMKAAMPTIDLEPVE